MLPHDRTDGDRAVRDRAPRRRTGRARTGVPVVVLAALLAGLAAGCGGADPAPPPDPAAQAGDAVRATFTGYTQALLRRDFATACSALTEDARKALVADLNTKNIPVQTCEQGYAALYTTAAADALDQQGRTITVTDVRVDGDTATLTYTGKVKDRTITQTVRAQRFGLTWLIAPAG